MINKDTEQLKELVERARKIKALVLDVDGVLTDARIIYGNYGDEIKNFDVNDGFGVFLMKKAGIKCAILTAKASKIVERRAKGLKFDKIYAGYHLKIKVLEKMKRQLRVQNDEICFMGDELIDVPILKRVGLAVCPQNAMDEVKQISHYITKKSGGHGAVRELCDFILKAQGVWDKVTQVYLND